MSEIVGHVIRHLGEGTPVTVHIRGVRQGAGRKTVWCEVGGTGGVTTAWPGRTRGR
ncbi:hypothetical protein [Streptomyces sp. NPDC048196]|uniref:hypothetical protein n=1 Tax=Streptomyces sp. NPDC048196 TaxID=3154712 RepID=UPI0033D1E0B4